MVVKPIDDLLPFTDVIALFGHPCRVVALRKLIALKRAAGRPKDNEILAELEALLEAYGRDRG